MHTKRGRSRKRQTEKERQKQRQTKKETERERSYIGQRDIKRAESVRNWYEFEASTTAAKPPK